MRRSTVDQGIAEHRRRRVAHHRLRGLTEREIAAALEQEGLRNPDTEEPWTYVTVHRDCVALTVQWRREALGDTAPIKAELWAEIRAARRQAWETGDLTTVLRALKQEAELLGLDEPARVDVELRVRELATLRGLDPEAAVDEVRRILRESARA